MEALDRHLERVTTALAYFACAIVTCMFVMIVTDVTIRTLGFTPPSFTLSVVEYALLYFAMCCAPYLVRHRGHVTIEALAREGLTHGVMEARGYLIETDGLMPVVYAESDRQPEALTGQITQTELEKIGS